MKLLFAGALAGVLLTGCASDADTEAIKPAAAAPTGGQAGDAPKPAGSAADTLNPNGAQVIGPAERGGKLKVN